MNRQACRSRLGARKPYIFGGQRRHSSDRSYYSTAYEYYWDSDTDMSTTCKNVRTCNNRCRCCRDFHLLNEPTKWYPDNFVKSLGKGHFAEVYLSYSKKKREFFAVKRARQPRRNSGSTLRSLTKEAEILKRLDSPFIVKYLGEHRKITSIELGKQRMKASLVEEIYLPYFKRGTLTDLISATLKKGGRLDETCIKHYANQLLKGIHYIHSKGIIHCDIKGSNILVGKTHLNIADFGVAKSIEKQPRRNRYGQIFRAGTRAWMAPEVRTRKEQGFASDIWSFGCTVVQMITGKPPNSSQSRRFIGLLGKTRESSNTKAFQEQFIGLSAFLFDFLRKCFRKDPKARWTSEQLLSHPFMH